MQRCDVLIVGGGVIGLSLAHELAVQGLRVHAIDCGEFGRGSSWAGAGIIPPPPQTPTDAWQRLAKLSGELYPDWTARLRDESGIDVEYRRCGALYLAANDISARWLEEERGAWERLGLRYVRVDANAVSEWEPAAITAAGQPNVRAAYHLPDESQVRNPRLVRALAAACAGRGVQLTTRAELVAFVSEHSRVTGVRLATGAIAADCVCLAAGAWTQGLATQLGVDIPLAPVRGQMALLNPGRPLLTRIVNCGPRYLVPRADGRVLAGSTMEHVGFDARTTAEGIGGLLTMVGELAPGLAGAAVEQCWAGLRPGTPDGVPYLGRLPGWDNVFIAAGHLRSGLQLAPGTAAVMSELLRGHSPRIDLAMFCVERLGVSRGGR